MRSLSLFPVTTLQFQTLQWTCWCRLKVPAGQPEMTLKSLLAYVQVCPTPAPPPQAWTSLTQLASVHLPLGAV